MIKILSDQEQRIILEGLELWKKEYKGGALSLKSSDKSSVHKFIGFLKSEKEVMGGIKIVCGDKRIQTIRQILKSILTKAEYDLIKYGYLTPHVDVYDFNEKEYDAYISLQGIFKEDF